MKLTEAEKALLMRLADLHCMAVRTGSAEVLGLHGRFLINAELCRDGAVLLRITPRGAAWAARQRKIDGFGTRAAMVAGRVRALEQAQEGRA